MADPVTQNKSLVTPPNAADPGTWDQPVNNNAHALDSALGGLTILNAQGVGGAQALTLAQYTPANIVINGTPSSAVNYQLPPGVGGFYFITNNAPAGAPAVYLSSASGGPAYQIGSGQSATVVVDPTYGARRANTPVSPAGANGQMQFNSNGFFGANGNLTTDGTNFTCNGAVYANNGIIVPWIESTGGYQAATLPISQGVYTPSHDYGTLGGGTLFVDCRIGNVFKITLSGNVGVGLQNAGDGQTINLFIQQDANGNHSMSWPTGSTFYFSGGVPILSSGGYSIDLLVATYAGFWGVWMASLIKGFVPVP